MELWRFAVKACRRGGVEVWSSRGMSRARGRGGVCLKRSGDRELGRHAAGLDILEVWRCAAGVLPLSGMKLWSFAVKSCRCGGVCLKRSGAREACCGRGDVEARRGVCIKSSGALEVHCRRRDIEVWSSGASEACCRCRDVEEFASRGLEVCFGPGDVGV